MKKVTKTVESVVYNVTVYNKEQKSIEEVARTFGAEIKGRALHKAVKASIPENYSVVDIEEVRRVSGLYALGIDKFVALSDIVDKPVQGALNRSCEVVEYQVIMYNPETRGVESHSYTDYESSSPDDLTRHYNALLKAKGDKRKVIEFEPVAASVTMRSISLDVFLAHAEKIEKAE